MLSWKPLRLVAVVLVALLSVSAVGDALGHPPCCSEECSSDFCPLQQARRAQAAERPSCHLDPAAPASAAPTAAPRTTPHGPAFTAPGRRCAEDCANGAPASFAAPDAEPGERVDPSWAAPRQSPPAHHDGGWTPPASSRGPPLT